MLRRCLIIDDADDVRLLLRLTLTRAGFEVVAEAATAAAALDAAATEAPEVVLVDLMLPGSDGLATIASLRAILPDAQIAVCSGMPSQLVGPACFNAGADYFLEKTSLIDIGSRLARLLGPGQSQDRR